MVLKKIDSTKTDFLKLDSGFYENTDGTIIFVDKLKTYWFICVKENFPFELLKNEEKEEKKETDKTVSESFALKMVAVATGKVTDLDLNN